MVNVELENELDEFAEQWFDNIQERGYKLVKDTPEKETEGEAATEENISQETEFTPVWEQKPQKKGQTNFLLNPEIPQEKRNQYHITDDGLGQGTPKEKFRANIAAIQMLKKCEEESRLATADEQEILAGYVGWGSLSDAFDETKTAWGTEYLELKTVLTPEEYAAARESTLTAFYTPPVLIRAMYQVLENMGLKSGNILEPSCGIGNFIGLKPESLSDCRIYGVELDSVSGRIARLFVDEADNYKNLYLYTKMRNVGGIAQTEAQKSSDMFMKCRYLDEVTGGKGVIFATGTPVSNSMVELYTMQRYLQYNTLVKNGLQHFDAWASTFGETVTAIELAPEGTGYRLKTRFARFFNLPELMQMFREVADIQTADMLNLPVPEAEYRVVTVKPSDIQKEMVEELGNRAERVRNGMVNPMKDNMLLITNDGRKLALDQRLANEMLPDEPESKVNACAQEVWRFWISGREKKLTQLVFCDLSTPRNDGTFSVYNDLRKKLMAKGIPPEEIAFIHDANTEVKKKELFSKVRRGAVRVLMGSTFKMGAGTNVQDLIIASHDLDCPWRPRDLEQRAGRTVRQGNKNKKVDIIRYVTEGTFDAYLYQVIENKQKFISQIMTSKSPARSVEDIDETALSYAEIKALATGNPHIKEKMDLDIQVSKLQLLKQSFLSQKYEMEDKVTKHFPDKIRRQEQNITAYEADIL